MSDFVNTPHMYPPQAVLAEHDSVQQTPEEEPARNSEPSNPMLRTLLGLEAPMTNSTIARETKAQPVSIGSAPFALVAVVNKIEELAGPGVKWTPGNDEFGKRFLASLPEYRAQFSASESYVTSVAQRGGVDQVNSFLKEKGFDISLSPTGNADSISAAAVFDLKVTWKKPGDALLVGLDDGGEAVPGVWLRSMQGFFSAPGHKYPIVELATQSGERFFMTRYDTALAEGDPLAAYTAALNIAERREPADSSKYPSGVQFPMADFERSGDVNALIGAGLGNGNDKSYVLGEVKYAHRFRLNEVGARAEAANAATALRTAPTPYIVNGPYLAWFEIGDGAQGKPTIPFAVHITRESMKQPAGL